MQQGQFLLQQHLLPLQLPRQGVKVCCIVCLLRLCRIEHAVWCWWRRGHCVQAQHGQARSKLGRAAGSPGRQATSCNEALRCCAAVGNNVHRRDAVSLCLAIAGSCCLGRDRWSRPQLLWLGALDGLILLAAELHGQAPGAQVLLARRHPLLCLLGRSGLVQAPAQAASPQHQAQDCRSDGGRYGLVSQDMGAPHS